MAAEGSVEWRMLPSEDGLSVVRQIAVGSRIGADLLRLAGASAKSESYSATY